MSENVDGTYIDIIRRGRDGVVDLGSLLMDGLSGVCQSGFRRT